MNLFIIITQYTNMTFILFTVNSEARQSRSSTGQQIMECVTSWFEKKYLFKDII